jgi:4-amino-4-deoxy-L-arabinose transferase-like glycosyltransferase
VAALHLLPLALLGPWWLRAAESAASPRRWGPWYAGVGVAVLVGAAIALAWAIPTALAGGGEFGREIFWSQSVDRMVSTDHHLRPFWFYVAMAPVLVLPWLFLPTVWRGFAALAGSGRSLTVRFAAAWLAPVAIGFSLFKGKQIQYLLPEVPAFALLAAAGLSALKTETKRWEPLAVAMVFAALAVTLVWLSFQPRLAHLVQPADRPWVWLSAAVLAAVAAAVAVAPLRDRVATVTTIAAAGVAVVVGGYAGVGRAVFDGYDIAPVARHLAQAQQQGRPIAHFAKYHGQFQFVGRLTQPIEVIATAPELLAWAQRNPDGVVIVYAREPLTHADGRPPQFRQKFKGRNVYVWRGADLAGVSANWHRVENDGDGS